MNRLRAFLIASGLACASLASSAAETAAAPPDIVLRGHLDGRDNHTYRRVPFTVPAGVRRISVAFEYTGREQKTTIDLGLLGPDGFSAGDGSGGGDGFRGWSGGNKSTFTISATDATPSYLAGPIRAGRWSLVLGIPNIRADARSDYVARVFFSRDDDDTAVRVVEKHALRDGPGWFRGDLHMHTAHSDASCASQSGARVPCPLFVTAERAVARKLDFIAISDHNTVSQAAPIRELQPYFDRLLLMPARELTTFEGHANVFGTFAPIDFRIGSAKIPDWNAVLARVAALGATLAINHPIRPSDERCMGCGWTPHGAFDYGKVQAVEVVNGLDADTPHSGVPFWQDLLNRGYRPTAIGGSDSHDATQMASGIGSGEIGRPTTVVYARELSTPAILEGLRAGHAYVVVDGSAERRFDFTASSGGARATMGDTLRVVRGGAASFVVELAGFAQARIDFIEDGARKAERTRAADGHAVLRETFEINGDGRRHWLRADVRDGDGRLLVVGNPIYFGE